jgi:hypothetical protein
MPGLEEGQTQFVVDPGRPVVQPHVTPEALGGTVVPEQRVIDVAEEFERPRRSGVDRGGVPQVPHRRLQLAPAPVGLPALQVSQHRLAFEGDGAAEGLYGREGVVPGQRRLPLLDVLPVASLPPRRRPGIGRRQGDEQQESGQKRAFHVCNLPERRDFGGQEQFTGSGI